MRGGGGGMGLNKRDRGEGGGMGEATQNVRENYKSDGFENNAPGLYTL